VLIVVRSLFKIVLNTVRILLNSNVNSAVVLHSGSVGETHTSVSLVIKSNAVGNM